MTDSDDRILEARFWELNAQFREKFGKDIPLTIGFDLEYYFQPRVLERVELAIKTNNPDMEFVDLDPNATY